MGAVDSRDIRLLSSHKAQASMPNGEALAGWLHAGLVVAIAVDRMNV
jgi:hypothetical protein